MSSATVSLPRLPKLRRGSLVLLIVVASSVAIGVYVLLHKDVPLPYATFRGACQRLRASGLPITDRDWFCHPIPWTKHAGFMAASILAAGAFAVPCAILAATGHRLAALAPLLVLPFATYPTIMYANGIRWWQGTWPAGEVTGAAVTVMLVLVPAVVIAAVRRTPVTRRRPISLVGGAVAAVACGLALIPLGYLTDAMFDRHFEAIDVSFGSVSLLWPAVSMGLFAAVLGTDRRWWPWALAPAAFLLSFAPASAFLVGPEGIQDWSLFGAVLPLFLVGLICSVWRSLAVPVTRTVTNEGGTNEMVVAPTTFARPWPVVVNAVAAGLLALSVIVFGADPLPADIARSLPTYLGERVAVQDVRMKMNLRMAIDAMDRYRADTGSYRGFNAEVGAAIEPRLAWTDRPADASEPLWTWIAASKGTVSRVAGVSSSGNAFCLQRTQHGLTFGTASGELGSVTPDRVLRRAVSACGQMPWSESAIQPPRFETMCDDLDPSGGYLLCRMVQVVNVAQLRQTKPDGT